MLLWPLFVAGIVESPHHGLRRWVVKCLEMIGHTMGLDQALAVAEIISADPGILHSVTEEDDGLIEESNLPDLTSRLPVPLSN